MIPVFGHKKPDFDNFFYITQWGNFVKAWKWHNEKGEWIFCTALYEKECFEKNYSATKERKMKRTFKTFTYENSEWKISDEIFSFFDIPGIISGKKPVVIVDNELSVDILNKTNQNDFTFTTWNGDLSILEKLDFSIFDNKQVYYFSSSWILSKNIISFLEKKIKDITIIPPMVDRPWWNIADDLENLQLTPELIRQWIITEKKEPEEKQEEKFVENIKWPFKILGPGSGFFYFVTGESGEIFKARQGAINNNQLLHLAPIEFWRDYFGLETKRGVSISWINAQDALIRACNSKPVFDHNDIRGRGIWQDGDGLIIHTGEELIFGNRIVKVQDYEPNGHAYERVKKKNLSIKKLEISKEELSKIISCINKLSVNTMLEKIYLLGWCVLAPFCSALTWRPHIWITGPSGSGKSTVLEMIILKLLGDFVFPAEGGSTGAGIIQNMRNDCFPVVHDEVDKTAEGRENLKFEIEIARSCSSSKRPLWKGTADQTGKRYHYTMSFCFSSINIIIASKNDASRFSIVNMHENKDIPWNLFRKEIHETFNTETCEKLRSMIFYNWNTVKKNIEMFRDEAGNFFGSQRTGDQIGTLLCGYSMVDNFKPYEKSEVNDICKKYLPEYNDTETISDETLLLIKIFTTRIKYLNHDNRTEDTTLLNLLKRAVGEMTADNIPDQRAMQELFKYGISLQNENIYIAYNYEWIKEILKNTNWYDNYGEVLKRLNFAEKKTKVIRFGTYYHGRAVELKSKFVLRLSDDNIFMEAGI